MNRLFSLSCMGIRVHKGHAPLDLWCRTGTPTPDEDPLGPTCKDWTTPEAKWMEQVARHLVPIPGRHIYPPSTSGQYDLRLRAQLMLPPTGTVFVLVPTAPLARADPRCVRPIPIHRLVAQLPVQAHVYLAFVSLPEAIFHANHTVRYPVSIRAVNDETTPMRFQNLSTVEHCTSLGLEQRSSVCRYAVSLGLVVYYPYGQTGTEQHLPSPEALSTDDIPTPTPGWMAPVEQAYHTPTKDAHIMAREWAESTLMTDHLVCLASRWMMSFHAAFLDKTVTTLALEMRQTEVLFLTYWTHITHKPRFARRNQVRYGAAFSSAAQALRYAATETDVRYIYILPVSQCQIIDQTAPHLAIAPWHPRARSRYRCCPGGHRLHPHGPFPGTRPSTACLRHATASSRDRRPSPSECVAERRSVLHTHDMRHHGVDGANDTGSPHTGEALLARHM